MADEQLKLEAQEALNELWNEHRLPFKLTAYHVDPLKDIVDVYFIEFFDSRIPHFIVEWRPARGPFKLAVRDAFDQWVCDKNVEKTH